MVSAATTPNNNGLTTINGPGTFYKDGAGTFEVRERNAQNLSTQVQFQGGLEIRGGTFRMDVNNFLPGSTIKPIARVSNGTLLFNTTNLVGLTDNAGLANGTITQMIGNGSVIRKDRHARREPETNGVRPTARVHHRVAQHHRMEPFVSHQQALIRHKPSCTSCLRKTPTGTKS